MNTISIAQSTTGNNNKNTLKSDSSCLVDDSSPATTATSSPSENVIIDHNGQQSSCPQPKHENIGNSSPCSHQPHAMNPIINTNETKILYTMDPKEVPYLVKLPIPHSQIKLSDFKAAITLPTPHYKFFFKSYDKEVGIVKEEIFDDDAPLPIFKDRVVAWLVPTNEGSVISDSTNSQCQTEISATGHRPVPTHRSSHERNGLIGDSHPPSYHGNRADHCCQTTETESIMSSRNGAMHSNHRRGYKSGQHGKCMNGYNGNGNYHHDHQNHHHHHHGNYMESSVLTSDMESTSFVDSEEEDDDDDLLDTGVDDDNDYEDYTSRISTTTEETSVSRQYARRNRKRRPRGFANRNRMSRTSSLSSISESSMSLNIIQVILNLDTVNYLGISLVGQTSKKGDGGIYVSSILKGGAVALDGRIEPGDMILQVNDINLENLTNDEAVEVIRDAVKKPGPIKLLVAKCWDPHPKGHFTIPRSEPVRPIDPGAWVAHTEAARAKFTNPDNFPLNLAPSGNFMTNSSVSSSLPEQEPASIFQQTQFAQFSQTHNPYPLAASAIESNSLVAGTVQSSFRAGGHQNAGPSMLPQSQQQHATGLIQMPVRSLTIESDLETIACAMASPNSGLDVRDRMWLKISIPNAFLGSDVVDWLFANVPGLHDRKDAKKLASKLLKEHYICHTINIKSSFSEKCYYIFSEKLQQLNKSTTLEHRVNSSDFDVVTSRTLPNSNEFDEKFSHALRLNNDPFVENIADHVQSNFDTNVAKTQRSKLPFMCYWDEQSEIRNYGLFGPQPSDLATRNDGNNSNHSGGNHGGSHDQYQSDEQMSQQSGQSILYNVHCSTINNVAPITSNTLKSSGSCGSNHLQQPDASNSLVGHNAGNLINHHYEDLQMNPLTGNLVPSSSITSNHDENNKRVLEGNEAIDLSQSNKTILNSMNVNDEQQQPESRLTSLMTEQIAGPKSSFVRALLMNTKNQTNQHAASIRSNSSNNSNNNGKNIAQITRNSFKKAIGKS